METKSKPPRKPTTNKTKSKFDPNYFTWPHPFFMIILPLGLYFLVAATCFPDSIPAIFGPVGEFSKFIGTNYHNACVLISCITLVIHVLEAAYAGKVCHDRGMTASATAKWAFSTFLFGFSSLILRLLPYKPNDKRL